MKTDFLTHPNSAGLGAIIMVAMLGASGSLSIANTSSSKAYAISNQQPAENDTLPGFSDELEEIVITADKPMISVQEGKINYSVAEDPSAAGTSMLEMLRKVPLVTVDGDDNIKLNGQSNFKFLINGKEEPSFTQNAKTILKAMPASAVQKIEVNTEPGAKYDAEGCSGLINLITEVTQKNDGYNANISFDLGKQVSSISAFGRGKYGKIGFNANAVYAMNVVFPQKSSTAQEITRRDNVGNIIDETKSSASQKARFHFVQAGAGMSYEPDDKNLFTLSLNYNRFYAWADFKEHFGNPDPLYDRYIDAKIGNESITGGLDYQHNFSEKHFIVANYQTNFSRNSMKLYNNYDYLSGIDFLHNINNNGTITRENTAQIDYTLPFLANKMLFETGVKGIFRHNTSAGHTLQNDMDFEGSNLLQRQQVGAVYATFTGRFSQLTAKAGIRYEHSHTHITERAENKTDFQSSLDDVVPNASIAWMIGETSNVRASYQMRIVRPNITQLNPYSDINLGGIHQSGNPNLNSEKSHQVGVTCSDFGRLIGFSATIEYHRINGMITNILEVKDGKIYSMPMNIGYKNMPQLSMMVNWNIIPRMSLSINGSVNYVDMHGGEYCNHGFTGNWGANWTYSTFAGYAFNAYGGMGTRNINLQGTSAPWHYYGVSVSKTMLKDKSLTLALKAGNFFEGQQKFKDCTISKYVESNRVWSSDNWNVGVALSWTFGSQHNLRERSVSKQIENTDTKSSQGGANTGGSIGL